MLLGCGIPLVSTSGWSAVEQHLRPLRWPVVRGRVIAQENTPTTVAVAFDFSVHGYPCLAWYTFWGKDDADPIREKYPIGSHHDLRYDPDDFGRIRIVGEYPLRGILLFAAVGAASCVRGWQLLRRVPTM